MNNAHLNEDLSIKKPNCKKQNLFFSISIVAIFLIIIILVFEFTNLDILIQNLFYKKQNNQWLIDKNNQILKLIFYNGLKGLLIIFLSSIFLSLIFFRKKFLIQKYRQGLIIVLLSGILIPSIIGSLKAITNIPCPRNIIYYSGKSPNIKILEHYPINFQQKEKAKCWPAGHASGGFSLLSLFFLFNTKRNRIKVIIAALTIGWSIGLYKMTIGDHFFSHTLISMIIAWLTILIIVRFIQNYHWSHLNGNDK